MRAFLVFVCLFWTLLAVAQQPEKVVGAGMDTLPQPQNTAPTANVKPVAPSDTVGPRRHSPKTATLLSLCIPGAGQVYNRKNWWWKVPVIYGAGAALISGAIYNNKNYNDFKNAYVFKLENPDQPTGDPRYDKYSDPATLKSIRDSYKDARDQCVIGLGLLYALQVLDAGVEAHFLDFNVSEDLSLNVQPQIVRYGLANYSGVQLTLTF